MSFGGNGFTLQISPPPGPAMAYTESLTAGVPFEFASTTPLPAALPPFATGLAAFGSVRLAQETKERRCFRNRIIRALD
jgi:hypothetical protein